MSYFPTSWRQWAGTATDARPRPGEPGPDLRDGAPPAERWPSEAGPSIGHVALAVGSLDCSVHFYCDALGFAVTGRLGEDAVFLAAGGYHHHLALAAAALPDGDAPAPGAPGLHHVAIRYPNRAALAATVRRLRDNGAAIEDAADHGFNEAVYLRDPDGNRVELYADRPPEAWPRDDAGALRLVQTPLDLDRFLAEFAPSGAGT